MADSYKGKLLVAQPGLDDPNFIRTVVLVLEHNEDGTLGVVINRPTVATVAEHLEEWRSVVSSPELVFAGGPVQQEVGICLARLITASEGDWEPLVDDLGIVDLGQLPAEQGIVTDARVFAGYAGWDTAQLEWELALDSWFLVDASAEDLTTSDPLDLWRTVLRRQEGRTAFYAEFPADPEMN